MKRWQTLTRLANDRGWRAGVELGVFRGETFKFLLTNCRRLRLSGVDLFSTEYYAGTREGRPPKKFDLEAEFQALSAWVKRNAPGRGALVRETTQDAARRFDVGTLDFVFVDADHRYEAVSADIDTWMPKIRPGGMMLGHDYNEPEFPGVVQAVRERFGVAVKLYPDHVWGVVC